MGSWFRVYDHELPKIGQLSPAAVVAWLHIIAACARSRPPGTGGLTPAALAERMGCTAEDASYAGRELQNAGLVAWSADGVWMDAKGAARKPDPDAAERQRRARAARRSQNVQCHGDTTPECHRDMSNGAGFSPAVTVTFLADTASPSPSPSSLPPLSPLNPLSPPSAPPSPPTPTTTPAGDQPKPLALTLVAVEQPEAVEILPVRGGMFPIHRADLEAWQRAYPQVNVEAALARMFAYLDAQPSSARPTPQGCKRFVNTWLRRDHDRAADRGARGFAARVVDGGKSKTRAAVERMLDAGGGDEG